LPSNVRLLNIVFENTGGNLLGNSSGGTLSDRRLRVSEVNTLVSYFSPPVYDQQEVAKMLLHYLLATFVMAQEPELDWSFYYKPRHSAQNFIEWFHSGLWFPTPS